MKFYLDEIGYPCKWKTKMVSDNWYSMQPVKLKITLPRNVYDEFLKNKITGLDFKILKEPGEKIYITKSDDSVLEFWKLSSIF